MATTLLDLKRATASYLNKDLDDLTQEVDLFLVAANQAKRQAELNHDFEFSRKMVTVSVSGATGGTLTAAVDSNAVPVEIKTVIEVGLLDDLGNLRPIEWTTTAESIERQRVNNRFGGIPRYPTDGQSLFGPCGGSRFTFSGDSVQLWPRRTESNNLTYSLWLEVYSMTADWTAADLEDNSISDTWTTKGGQYIQWMSIIHLNKLFMRFAPRQEGVLGEPTELANSALASLIEWDSARFEQFRRHQR